jgi:hypothetical protein
MKLAPSLKLSEPVSPEGVESQITICIRTGSFDWTYSQSVVGCPRHAYRRWSRRFPFSPRPDDNG